MNIEEVKQASAVMQAFAEGKKIEYKARDYTTLAPWSPNDRPVWNWVAFEYRVKREVVKYRMALMQNSEGAYWVGVANSVAQAENYESHNRFVRWLTDWQEVNA